MTECVVKYYPTDENNPDGWKSGKVIIDDEDGKRMIILMDPDEMEVRWVRHEHHRHGDVIVSHPGKPGKGERIRWREKKTLRIFGGRLTLEIDHATGSGNDV